MVFVVLDFDVFEFRVHAQDEIAREVPGRGSAGKKGVAEFIALVIDGLKGYSDCWILNVFVVLACLEI